MDIVYMNECYKHRWLLDYVTEQVDLLSYKVTNTWKLENRIYCYVGKYLVENEGSYKNRAYIKRLVMKKIKESIPRFGGANEDVVDELMSKGYASAYDCWSSHTSLRSEIATWVETLGGDNPRHRTIVAAIASGYSLTDTAELLSEKFGGKVECGWSCIKRFKSKCKKNKSELLNSLYVV